MGGEAWERIAEFRASIRRLFFMVHACIEREERRGEATDGCQELRAFIRRLFFIVSACIDREERREAGRTDSRSSAR